MNPTECIRTRAVELGFDLVGIAPAGPARHADAFFEWIKRGYHGKMEWLAKAPQRRTDPRQVLPGARSVVSVGYSYYVADPPAELWDDPSRGRIARYAWGPDYHDQLTPKLKTLSTFIKEETGGQAKYYVDTGPVLERAAAAEAGLGFIGKNSLLIHPAFGSYLFLAVLLVDVELDYDVPAQQEGAAIIRNIAKGETGEGTCGTCRRCLEICPTHAFPAPYVLDSNQCISYLTIELKGSIPESLRPKMKNWIYGCDECQTICPWVKRYSQQSGSQFLRFDPTWCIPRLKELMALDEDGFRARFRGTPVKRAKRRGLLRNVAVALGNWGDSSAKRVLENALHDPEPLIREHAKWALDRLSG